MQGASFQVNLKLTAISKDKLNQICIINGH